MLSCRGSVPLHEKILGRQANANDHSHRDLSAMKIVLIKTVWGCDEMADPAQWAGLLRRIRVRRAGHEARLFSVDAARPGQQAPHESQRNRRMKGFMAWRRR